KSRKRNKLDVYVHENMLIGITYEKVGQTEKAKEFIQSYKDYIETDQTAYKQLGLSMYYAHFGDIDKAMEHFRAFSKEDNILYWVILFLTDDPIVDEFEKEPEFQEIWTKVKEKFWENNRKIREKLDEEGLL